MRSGPINASRRLSTVLPALLLLPACQTARVLTNRCVAPYVAGTATVEVASASDPRRYALAGDGGRVGAERHDLLQAALLGGEVAADTGITWALTSAEGARLVVTHRARLEVGQRLMIAGYPGRRDWGPSPAPPMGAAGVALFLPGTDGTRVAGAIEVLRLAPVELRLDLRIDPRSDLPVSGEPTPPTAVTGAVRFRRANEERPCFS